MGTGLLTFNLRHPTLVNTAHLALLYVHVHVTGKEVFSYLMDIYIVFLLIYNIVQHFVSTQHKTIQKSKLQ